MNLKERSRLRRKSMAVHRAEDHDDAELWDLMFWQACTPEERLSALVHIHQDVKRVIESRGEKS